MNDLRNLFKPEMFRELYKSIMKDGYMSHGAGDMWEPSSRYEDMSEKAQQILNAELDKATVVYTQLGAENSSFTREQYRIDTHKALLVCVEKIDKKPCVHEPNQLNQSTGGWFCKHCNKKIKATWSEV